MSSHTLGPWTANHWDYCDTWSVESVSGVVANLWYLEEDTHNRCQFQEDSVAANARLIAAAPDLLRECKLAWLDHQPTLVGEWSCTCSRCERLAVVIELATGKRP